MLGFQPLSSAALSALASTSPPVGPTVASKRKLRQSYTCTLTGAPDSLTDVILPLASISSRLVSGSPSYLQVVLPYSPDLVDLIKARPNGVIIVNQSIIYADGTSVSIELARANFETLRYDIGGNSGSITLTGHKQTTYSTPKGVSFDRWIYQSVDAGRRTFRLEVDSTVRPADVAHCGTDEFTVGSISIAISANQAWMELQESV